MHEHSLRSQAQPLIARAGALTIGELLTAQARRVPRHTALVDGPRRLDYLALNSRVNRLAHGLQRMHLGRGDRVGILAENRSEYIECAFAAAKLGIILCALNWRLAKDELRHCIAIVEPQLIVVSERFQSMLKEAEWTGPVVEFGTAYEDLLDRHADAEPAVAAEPEDGLFILYTSGTTGLPKGALISHRAELARMMVSRIDFGLQEDDTFVAWPPMFHMASLEHAVHVLGLGGTVIIVDGADIPRLVELIGSERQWWLILLPGMIDRVIAEVKARGVRPKGIKIAGALADLVPLQTISETSALLQAPYWNTFGSTETGMLPVAGGKFRPGEIPASLAKTHNSLYRWRLVDENDDEVEPGTPGEITVRGPTLFSGYWRADNVNAVEFRGGWFHMGDTFIEQVDGSLSYVDRSKYLIKSGGENIYPVEIERVLMADERVAEAVVVRRRDPVWGEVPVAFVVCNAHHVTAEDLMKICRTGLSSYKCPREIRLVGSQSEFPRSTSGKVQRQLVEKWLEG
jgi:fatty-acyl-CoA synthase